MIRLVWFGFMVLNATFNNISVTSWRSVLLVKETGVPGENHWLVASHWQTLSHNVVSSVHLAWVEFDLTLVVIGTDCTGSLNPTTIRSRHMSFSKWNKRMVPYSITVYFVTLVFIHLNFHCWEACNLNNLAIFFFFNQYNFNFYSNHYRGRRGRDRMVVGFKLPVQSVPITTNVRSNSTQARCTDDTETCVVSIREMLVLFWYFPPVMTEHSHLGYYILS
jgi:hypothetical protein